MSAGDFDYDANGAGYAQQRRPDPRIAAAINAALGDARTVLNVGAGTGSYEPAGRYVFALEPSARMRAQRPPGAAPALRGIAEDLPFDEGSIDASMAVATIHQWKNLTKGLSELTRVTRGPVVVVTFDGDMLEQYWLSHYAPELIAAERYRYPPIDTLRAWLGTRGRSVEVRAIPIPSDCSDGIIEAYYARPERLLESAVRQAQSSWGFVAEEVQARFVARLREDLRTGAWDERYGALRNQPLYDGSLRLVVSVPRELPRLVK